jgi:hypothetical protein
MTAHPAPVGWMGTSSTGLPVEMASETIATLSAVTEIVSAHSRSSA